MAEERDPKTYAIIGAAMEVHRVLGPGFLEKVYQEALALELSERGIPYEREVLLPIEYKGRRLAAKYFSDFFAINRSSLSAKRPRVLRAQMSHKPSII